MNYLLFIVVVYLTYLTLRSIFLYYIQIKYKVYIGHLSFTKISNIKLESFELKKLSYRFRNWSFIITVDDLLITLPLKKRSEEPVELKEKSLSSLKGRISALLASKFFRILLTTIRLQFTNVNIRSEEFLFHLSKFQLQVNLPASIVHNQNMSFSIHSTIAPFELFYINNLSNLKMCLLYSNLESSFALYHTSAILFGEIIKPDIELKLKGFNFSINNIIKISKMNKYNQATPPPYAKTIISLTESATEDVKVIITEKICNIIDNITPVLNEVALVQPNFIFLINDTKFQLRGDHNSDNLDFDSGFGKFNVLNNLITEEKSPTITMSLKNFSISLLVSNDAEKLIKLPLSQNLTWHQNKPLIEMQLTIASLNITINNIPNTFKSSEVLALPSLNIKFNSQLLPNPSLSFANRMKSSLGIQVEIEEPSFILEDSALKVLHLFQIKKEKRSDATPTNQNSSSLTDARIVAFEVIFNIFISLSVSIVVINPKIRNRYVITQSNESDIVFGFGECKILLWSGCEGNLETTTNSPLLNLQLSCKYIFLVFEKIIEGREKALDKLIAEPEWTFIANCGIELLNDDEEFDRNLSKQNFVPVNDYQKKYIYKTFIVNLSVELGSIFLNLIKISDSENVSEYHLIIQKIGELLNDMKFTKGVKVEETVTPILNVQKTSNFIPFLVNLNFNLKVEGKKLMVAVSGEDTRNSVIFCCEKYDWRQSVTLVNKVAQLKIHSSSQNPHIDMEPVERSYVRKNKTPTVPLICTVTSPEDNKTTFEDEIVDGNLSAYFSSFRRRPSISPDAKQVISDNFDLIKNFGANEKEDHKSSSKSSVGKPSAVVKPLKSVPLIKKFKKYQSNEQFRELVESENPFFKVARKSHKNSSSGTELSMPFESNNVTYIEELKIVEFQQLFTSGDAYACDISIKVVILCENCNLEASADNFSSYVEPLIQIKSLVVKIPLICHGNAPELSEHLSFSNKPLISPITEVKFHDVRFTFSIPTAYVLLLSVLWVKKLNKILNYVPEVKKKRVTLKNQEIVKFFIDNFDVQLHLQEVELRLEMKIIQMSFGDWWNQNLRCIVLLSASLDELKAFVPKSFKKFTLNKTDNEFVSADEVEDEYVWDEILFIQYLTIDLQKREFAKKLLLALNDKNSRTTNFNKNLEVKSQLLSPDSLKPADSPRKNETPFASADFKNCSSASNVETNACKFTTNNLKLDPEQMQNYVVLKFGSVVLRIPPLFELSDIIDSLIATNKSLKYLLNTLLDVPLSKMPNTGFTRIDVKTIPEILVDVGTFSLVLDDDPFETWLSRNFKLGLEEQSDRISRDRAFQRKVHILRNHRKHKVSPVDIGDDSDDSTNNLYTNESTEANIEKAWWQLQNFNADSWIKKLRGSPFHPPPLLKVNCVDLNFKFTAPELLTETIEETLHLMDPLQTPAKKVYDELIPRNIDVGFDSFLALLRDYSFPLVDLPSSAELFPNHKTWRTTGLVIIAEQFADDASKRWITVPVVPLPYDSIIFYRTINPVKLYLSLKTKIKVGSAKSLKLIWGASVDPAITDVTRVLDSFTKPNPDPSPLGGWWDKLRVMVHGNYQVDMGGGGDIRLQILSSFSPYRKKLSGLNLSSALSVVDGVEFVLAKGARIIFGTQEKHFKNNNVDNDTIVVETGVLIMTAPTSSGNDIDIEEGETECNTWSELVIAKLVGGVRVGFGIDFMIKVYSEDGEEEDEIFPTKTHCDIVLMTPQYVERLKKIAKRKSKFGLNFDSEMDYDAFLGFRANSMKIVVNILSPHPFYSSLTNPINSLCLDPASIDRVRLISNLYQSPLSNLPVHRGPLFMAGPIPTKPK
ncbi:hypothetical protein HK099_006868 [Clydaea vesicula]|uniref:FMP27/BLTP2/Hobbit GFWDK motif-containing RBG unit domain-containing protein n=1 Tax=Clydaea vesicula TaxID=447962 RepID=A0AAD5Y2X1_9FUNG|nr:hypothetical protein HK099_006868 [Clydaea vesicula]